MKQHSCSPCSDWRWLAPALSVVLLLCSFLAFTADAQTQPVPDGATRIDIKTNLADSVLFERVVTLLQADGYSGNFRTEKAKITTDSRSIDSGDWTARIVAVLADGAVRLRTEGNNKTTSPPVANELLAYKGKAEGPEKAGFARLDAFARHLLTSIPGSTITYHVLP